MFILEFSNSRLVWDGQNPFSARTCSGRPCRHQSAGAPNLSNERGARPHGYARGRPGAVQSRTLVPRERPPVQTRVWQKMMSKLAMLATILLPVALGACSKAEHSIAALDIGHSTHTEEAPEDHEGALEVKELFNRMNNQGKLQIEE